MVHSMDRLARNLDDLRRLVQGLTQRGVRIEFLKEHLTFTGEDSPMANLMLSVMGAFAEFERALIRERQREGIALAKLAMPDEPVLRKCWRDWMLEKLAQGDELDNSPTGTLVRYAADGIWLSELTEGITMSADHRRALVDSLNKMTLPA